MSDINYKPSNVPIDKRTIADTPCHTCVHFYNVYEAKTAITDNKKNVNIELNTICYCAANGIGLPFSSSAVNGIVPNVHDCGTYEKDTNVPILNIN